MKNVPIAFTQSLKKGLSDYSANVRLVNCYCAPDPGGRAESVLVPIPGSSTVLTASPAIGVGCRGSFMAPTGADEYGNLGTLYFVFGNSVFRYSRSGSLVLVGTFASNNVLGSCSFACNQAQTSADAFIYVCDGFTIYKFAAKASDASIASTWQEIAFLPHQPDGDLQVTPAYIAWSDYRLIMTVKDSSAWFYTETGTDTFRETNTYFGESSADKMVRLVAHAGSLWAFGAYSYDIFTRTGNRNNPYSSPKSASGKIGLASAESVAVVDDYLFWLGRGEVAANGVYMADRAGSITRVSDEGIENVIRGWLYSESAYGFAYVDKGQVFYCITSEFDKQTLCFNASTSRWHICSSSANGNESFWDVSYPVAGYEGQIVFGSRTSNDIAKMNSLEMTEYNGNPITRVWQSPVYISDLKKFRLVKLVFDADVGTSESYTDDADIWVELSMDGGRSWRERVSRSLGTKGQYNRQLIFHGGGLPRSLVIRLGTSDPSPVMFYSAIATIEQAAR